MALSSCRAQRPLSGGADRLLIFHEPEGTSNKGVLDMCDYSLQTIRSRPAKVGDKLTTRDFGTCTRGFAAAEDAAVAVCVLPGTELAFSNAVTLKDPRFFVGWKVERLDHTTAIFRQVNKNERSRIMTRSNFRTDALFS